MLKILRHKGVQKNIYYGLAVTVVLTFVVSGVLIGRDDDKTASTLAKFENRKISVHEYLNSYRAVQRQAGWMYGNDLAQMRSRINFKGEAWDRLLLLEHAKKKKIHATDQEVVGWVTKQQGFQKDGKFDDAFYRLYVERALRTTPRQFEEEVRQMLTIAKLQDEVKSGVGVPDEKLKELYQQQKTEKDLEYGLLRGETFEPQITVSEEELQPLYNVLKNQPAEEGKPPKSEQEMKEDLKKQLRQTQAGQLAVKKLQEIKGKIKNPADFENSLKSEKIEPVKLEKYKKGTYPEGIWPSENLQKAVENLKQGEISDAFDVPKGAMIVKVTNVHAFDEKKFEEEKTSFREQTESQKSREEMEKLLEELRNKLSLNLELMKQLFPADAS